MTGAMEEAAELAARAAVRDMARMLFDAGLLKGSPDDRAWVWMKQAERLKAERDELQSVLTEAAPAEVEVEGSFFAWHELPEVLGNYMRSLDESQREAKRYDTEVAQLRTRLARVRVRHRKMTLTGKCRVCRKTWPCDTIEDLDA